MKYVKSLEAIRATLDNESRDRASGIYFSISSMSQFCGKSKEVADASWFRWVDSWFEERTEATEIQNDIERAEKALADAKAKLVVLTTPKVITYPCVTPVDEDGDIVFNNKKQILSVDEGVFEVSTPFFGDTETDEADFVWVRINKEELRAGDTGYTSFAETPTFTNEYQVFKMMDNFNGVFVDTYGRICTARVGFKHYFKLVRKDSL